MGMQIKTISETVRERRKELRLTQSELAMASGTGVRFISDLENGKETLRLDKTLEVMGALGIEIQLRTSSQR